MLAGTVGALGLGALREPLLAEQPKTKRKKLLLLFQSGGASQLETWDPKPGTKYGGPFRAIPTSIPGTHISELLPYSAKIMHRLAVLRGLNTGITSHFHGHYALQSGHAAPGYPVLGSVIAKLLEQPGDVLPGYVSIRRDGPKAYTDVGDAGFLNPKYEAVKVENTDPPPFLQRNKYVDANRAKKLDELRKSADARFLEGRAAQPVQSYSNTFAQAAALMKQREIFDLEKEPARDRERYGKHLFGQQCLLARRLLENGVNCVRVNHHDWDAHQENFHWHQQRCLEFDQTFATLVNDFHERGLLENTLVIAMGEMGRTPRINAVAGRDHWGDAWSMAMTGCGIKQGVVHGKTSADGTEVTDGEVKLGDLFNTFLRAMDFSPRKSHRFNGQSIPIGDPAGKPIKEVLA